MGNIRDGRRFLGYWFYSVGNIHHWYKSMHGRHIRPLAYWERNVYVFLRIWYRGYIVFIMIDITRQFTLQLINIVVLNDSESLVFAVLNDRLS